MQVLCNIRTECWCPHPLNRGVHGIQVHFTVNSEQCWCPHPLNRGVHRIQVHFTVNTEQCCVHIRLIEVSTEYRFILQ